MNVGTLVPRRWARSRLPARWRINTMKIIFEDNHLLVIEKPIGILSQKDKSGDEDISSLLKKYLKEKYSKPGNVYIGHVHRLDRNVGGVMVFAKTTKAASRISLQIREGIFKKEYLAVLEGVLKEKQGTLKHYLMKDKKTNIVKASAVSKAGYKQSLLSYSVVEEKSNMTFVKIDLLTGRSHQIRVQFSEIGHPVIGDSKYGSKKTTFKMALWSYQISFLHPTRKEKVLFSCVPQKNALWNIFSVHKKDLI